MRLYRILLHQMGHVQKTRALQFKVGQKSVLTTRIWFSMNPQQLPWGTIFSHRQKEMRSKLNLLLDIFSIRQEHYESTSIIPHYLLAAIREVLFVSCLFVRSVSTKNGAHLWTPKSGGDSHLWVELNHWMYEESIQVIMDEACWNSSSIHFPTSIWKVLYHLSK